MLPSRSETREPAKSISRRGKRLENFEVSPVSMSLIRQLLEEVEDLLRRGLELELHLQEEDQVVDLPAFHREERRREVDPSEPVEVEPRLGELSQNFGRLFHRRAVEDRETGCVRGLEIESGHQKSQVPEELLLDDEALDVGEVGLRDPAVRGHQLLEVLEKESVGSGEVAGLVERVLLPRSIVFELLERLLEGQVLISLLSQARRPASSAPPSG